MNKIVIIAIAVIIIIAAGIIITGFKPQGYENANQGLPHLNQSGLGSNQTGPDIQKVDETKYKNSESAFFAELINFIIEKLSEK